MTTLAPDLHTRRQPLYDSRTIPAVGGALVTTFFQGAPAANAWGFGTNMTADGQLPAPETFELFAPRIVPALGTVDTDMRLVVSCFTQLLFNNRDFFVGPGWLLPAGAGLGGGYAATTVGATTIQGATHGTPHPSAVMSLEDRSLLIEPLQAFRQTMDYNAPAALPVGATLCHVVWDGLHTRAAA